MAGEAVEQAAAAAAAEGEAAEAALVAGAKGWAVGGRADKVSAAGLEVAMVGVGRCDTVGMLGT